MELDLNKLNVLKKIVEDSRKAQQKLVEITNAEVNNLILGISSKILTEKNNKHLSSLAVKETKFGNIQDKMKKNLYKTTNLLNELVNIPTLKPIHNKKTNISTIIKPIGVICGVTPSTNPIATSLNYIINSIKCRNSIILCPNPRSYNTVNELVELVKLVFKEKKFSEKLVQISPKDILRSELLINLFDLCDKNVVTGSQVAISKVKKYIKPFLVFGTGNVPVIIDDKIDINKTTTSIMESKSFDHSTSCSSDSVLIINKKIYKKFLLQFSKVGAYVLNKKEKKDFDNIYFKKGVINTEIIAKKPSKILQLIGINNNEAKVIVYEITSSENKHYILDEKILPVIAAVKSPDFNTSINFANSVLVINGKGHSAGIYSKNKKNILEFASKIPVSRIIVNQPHSKSAGGGENNSLNTTLSLGCGAWGNNNLNSNLSYKEFCNESKIVFKKKRKFKDLNKLILINKLIK